MHKVYLPHYLENSKELHTIITSKKFDHLTTIKVKNYTLLETIFSHAKLTKIISSITADITPNSPKCKAICVEDYIFIFTTDSSSPAQQALQESLGDSASRHCDLHMEFQILFSSGDLKTQLPCAVQILSCSSEYESNDAILQEYNLLNLLKVAIANKTAGFAYQPIIDSRSGDTIYHE